MLNDNDRIFTNLYGMHDRTLKGALSRGHWDGTNKLIKNGRAWIIDEIKVLVFVVEVVLDFQQASNGHLCQKKVMVGLLI